jgi:hypothetical protein
MIFLNSNLLSKIKKNYYKKKIKNFENENENLMKST